MKPNEHESDFVLFAYEEGRLEPEAIQRVESHLKICDECARNVRRYRALDAALDAPPHSEPLNLVERAIEKASRNPRARLLGRILGDPSRTARLSTQPTPKSENGRKAAWIMSVALVSAIALGGIAGYWASNREPRDKGNSARNGGGTSIFTGGGGISGGFGGGGVMSGGFGGGKSSGGGTGAGQSSGGFRFNENLLIGQKPLRESAETRTAISGSIQIEIDRVQVFSNYTHERSSYPYLMRIEGRIDSLNPRLSFSPSFIGTLQASGLDISPGLTMLTPINKNASDVGLRSAKFRTYLNTTKESLVRSLRFTLNPMTFRPDDIKTFRLDPEFEGSLTGETSDGALEYRLTLKKAVNLPNAKGYLPDLILYVTETYRGAENSLAVPFLEASPPWSIIGIGGSGGITSRGEKTTNGQAIIYELKRNVGSNKSEAENRHHPDAPVVIRYAPSSQLKPVPIEIPEIPMREVGR